MQKENLRALLSAAFRETFLSILDPEEAEAFRVFGNVVENRLLDRAAYDPGAPSHTHAEMRGAARDLEFLKAFLETVAHEREASELSVRDWRLASLAGEIAGDLGALAARLDGELACLASEPNGTS